MLSGLFADIINDTRKYIFKHKDVDKMIIKEARQVYGTQIRSYHEQQIVLQKQKEELERKIKTTPDGKNEYANEAAVLELSIQAMDEKQCEYQAYMEKVTEQWASVVNMEVIKKQGEAMEEYVIDMGKIMEVARRLMKGAIVPATDEKKLMEYSMELYQAAKNIGELTKDKEREEYETLWKEEKKTEAATDTLEESDNMEAFSDRTDVVEAVDVMKSESDME